MLSKKYRIRSSIAISYANNRMEFFKTNVRENVVLNISHNLINFFKLFNGHNDLKSIIDNSDYDAYSIENLVKFLHSKNILIEENTNYDKNIYKNKYRLINFLEEFCFSTQEVINVLDKISETPILVIGLGAVGSWVIDILARSGIRNFILVDNYKVELSNLHRQNFYTEEDIGKLKTDCVEKKLHQIDNNFYVKKYCKLLDEDFFRNFNENFCLAINCADYPNVDTTTKYIGDECMKRRVPHIIGGGYNLHLTLIGQSVIPFETACYECFREELEKKNVFYKNLKKLHRPIRKIGSFTPLCTFSASLTALEAFKILCGFYNKLTNTSVRIEFNIRDMDIERTIIEKNPHCNICGR